MCSRHPPVRSFVLVVVGLRMVEVVTVFLVVVGDGSCDGHDDGDRSRLALPCESPCLRSYSHISDNIGVERMRRAFHASLHTTHV